MAPGKRTKKDHKSSLSSSPPRVGGVRRRRQSFSVGDEGNSSDIEEDNTRVPAVNIFNNDEAGEEEEGEDGIGNKEQSKDVTEKKASSRATLVKSWKRKLLAKVFLGPLFGVIITLFVLYMSVDVNQLQFYKFIQENSFIPNIKSIASFAPFMNREGVDRIISFLNRMASSESKEKQSSPSRWGPGEKHRAMGSKPHHPVIIIPGIVSTGLELWEGLPCSDGFFRKRIWGSLNMLRFMFMEKECWLSHIKVDPITGSDPPNIKVRPAQGLEAADYFMPGYWVWGRIIENLSLVGYDPNNLVLASYDWRLEYSMLERRDHYFSSLKRQIEHLYHNNNINKKPIKVVLLAHSMGSLVTFYFLKWIEKHYGAQWINIHLEAMINVSGPMLGVPKAVSAFLSGEFRETAQLGELETYLLEMLFNKKERVGIFKAWNSGYSMLPKGGNIIWGDGSSDSAVDDYEKSNSFNHMIKFNTSPCKVKNLTCSSSNDLIFNTLPRAGKEKLQSQYSYGFRSPHDLDHAKYNLDPKYWSNPLEAPLPLAPNLTMYCLYGVGKATERAYQYNFNPRLLEKLQKGSQHRQKKDSSKATSTNTCSIDENELSSFLVNASHYYEHLETIPFSLNLSANDATASLVKGVYETDGDGTVPTLSNGYMCVHGWRQKYLNPAQLKTVTREYLHQPILSLRGGPLSSEHVDILGNEQLIDDILNIVSHVDGGKHDGDSEGERRGKPLEDRIYSSIKSWKLPFGWK